jgi:hypothetical protein
MPFIEAGSCEPLRVFTRLEPRLRETEFDDALAARVHDPMFMLGRQWQFGEFAGEDGGSAVFAMLARRVTAVAGPEGGLEPAVEAMPYEFPLLQRVRLGRALATRVDAVSPGMTRPRPEPCSGERSGRSTPRRPRPLPRRAIGPRLVGPECVRSLPGASMVCAPSRRSGRA